MPPGKSYSAKAKTRRLAAATSAINRARATIISARRGDISAPVSTRGFYGQWNRPRGLGPELKTIDSGTSTIAPVTAAGTVTLINGVATGTDFTNRVGRKTLMKTLLLTFTHSPPTASNSASGDVHRVIVFYDSQTNGAAPAVTDVIAIADALNPMQLTNRERFKILLDKRIALPAFVMAAGVPTAGDPRQLFWKKYLKINMDTVYGGSAATVGSVQTGGLFMAVLSQTATWNASYYSRVRFTDS